MSVLGKWYKMLTYLFQWLIVHVNLQSSCYVVDEHCYGAPQTEDFDAIDFPPGAYVLPYIMCLLCGPIKDGDET